jgi:phosphatidylglycerol:prolipoprotein diacylglycerol transferase
MDGVLGQLSAIPYFTLPTIPLGGIDLQPFGILVATGVLLGAWIGRLRGKYLGIDENEVRVLTGYLLVFGFLGAHLFDTLFYQWHELDDDPLLLIKVWDGISSYGGMLGGFLGWYVFCRVHKVEDKVVIGDLTLWGFLPGFTFGRMGCTIVHDHPGHRLAQGSDFFLAIDYPEKIVRARRELWECTTWHDTTGQCIDGRFVHEAKEKGQQIYELAAGPRHDLGWYELLFLLVLIAALVIITRAGRARRTGFIIGFLPLMYGPVRFVLDFFRLSESDPRYFGLTFAQHISIVTFLAGIYALWWVYHRPAWKPVAVPASTSDVDVPEPEHKPPPSRKKAIGAAKKKRKKK